MTYNELKYIQKQTIEMLFHLYGKKDWDMQDSEYQIAQYYLQKMYETIEIEESSVEEISHSYSSM